MSNNNYQRGAAFERRVMDLYEEAGYTVIRSAGSHSKADVIAIKAIYVAGVQQTDVLFTQCKYGSKISKKEREALFAMDLGPQVEMVVAWSEPRKPIMLYNKYGEFTLD